MNIPPGFIQATLKSQFTPLPYPTSDLTGQTYVVTGANVGLGLEAARHLVRLNASKVILGCRDTEKGERAKADIERTSGRTGVVEVWPVDLGQSESVIQFCDRVKRLDRIDCVLENAGVAGFYKEFEGWESTLKVNSIGTMLMAVSVIPALRASARKHNVIPRLTIVSSDAHVQAVFPERDAPSIFKALNTKDNYSDKYPVSKLIEVLSIRQIAPQLDDPGQPQIVVNATNPGFCKSSLTRDVPWWAQPFLIIAKFLLGRSSELGSRTLISAATAGPETNGKYMNDCVVRDPAKWICGAEGERVGKRVWNELAEILDNISPGVLADAGL